MAYISLKGWYKMNSVQIMMEEHQNILRMLKVVRSACYSILKDSQIDETDFKEMIDYIRVYADTHHHGKEEKFMFKKMQQNLGKMGENLITHGMLVEHDMGRLYMHDLEEALERVKQGDAESTLDVIANAISYTHLLERHIKKEDELIYPFGEKNLSAEDMEEVNKLTSEFENNAMEQGTQQHYQNVLERLENRYHVNA